jgi:hypothetical protein
MKANARLVLQNWNGAVWREAVLLYTAQLNPQFLDQVAAARWTTMTIGKDLAIASAGARTAIG